MHYYRPVEGDSNGLLGFSLLPSLTQAQTFAAHINCLLRFVLILGTDFIVPRGSFIVKSFNHQGSILQLTEKPSKAVLNLGSIY